ncbi:MAG: permease-like cell division protein FtsX [Patescibacteria group bacterium]
MFTRLSRIIKLGLNNFLRNWSLSIAAVVMTSLTLATITIFVILHFSAISATQAIKEKIDMVVYFYDEVPEKEIQDIQLKLSSRYDLDSIKYISKTDAMVKWQSRVIPQKIKDLVTSEENPLFRSIQIKTQNQQTLDDVVNILDNQLYRDKISKISYKENRDVIDKILRLTNFVNWAGSALSFVFIGISVIVIFNTVRLTIFSRREEIEIMELVGASSAFVNLPFVVEAIMYGILATIISMILLALGGKFVAPIISEQLYFLNINFQSYIFDSWYIIALLQVLLAVFITTVSSFFSTRRYIK